MEGRIDFDGIWFCTLEHMYRKSVFPRNRRPETAFYLKSGIPMEDGVRLRGMF